VVIDAPLLVELGMHHEVDRLIVVTSTKIQQMERLKKRDGRSPEEALKLFSSQMLVEEKEKLGDFVIRNEGSLEEMKKRAKEVFKELKKGNLQKSKEQ